ncbi:MAG: hypothetical protein BGP08_14850 [Rhizobiales bacterium 64-17]|nr:MAG: hypothetical protein BGP08_14850 [Rhizobiales bacterium 64-17]
MTGLYLLAGHLTPQPLPPYFGQTAELPRNFYETPREFSARQTARSAPAQSVPEVAAVADAPSAPVAEPAPEAKVVRKTPHPTRARQASDRSMPDRIRTARGIGDVMVPIRLE